MPTYYIGCCGEKDAYYTFMDAVDKLKKYDINASTFKPGREIFIMDYCIRFVNCADTLKTAGIRKIYGNFTSALKDIVEDLKKRNEELAKINEGLVSL